jgi:hypothetical protein
VTRYLVVFLIEVNDVSRVIVIQVSTWFVLCILDNHMLILLFHKYKHIILDRPAGLQV